MKITIDLEDLMSDLTADGIDGKLKDELVKSVINTTVYQINQEIKKKVDDQIQREVKNAIENEMIFTIRKEVEKIIPVSKIKSAKSPYTEITIAEYIKEQFINNSGWASPSSTIEKLCKGFADEMKKRYDIMFAAQIVNKMHENNLLKDDAILKLLDTK